LVFETNIFSELLKNFGSKSVYYWRTKSKQEVDFIVKGKNQVIPIEAKISSNQFRQEGIKSFLKKYQPQNWYIIELEGKKITTIIFFLGS